MSYWPAFLLGFTGSLHCVAMCGPLAMAVPAGAKLSSRWALNRLVYQAGRIITYALLGLIVALAGKSINLAGWQQGLSVVSGIFLIVWALNTAGVERWLGNTPLTFSILNRFRKYLNKALRKGGLLAHISLGVFNGFLPCGLVYLALTGALVSANIQVGIYWMVTFGLGTLPAIILTLTLGTLAKRPAQFAWRYATPIVSASLGILLIVRGLDLGVPYLSPVLQWAEKSIPICGT